MKPSGKSKNKNKKNKKNRIAFTHFQSSVFQWSSVIIHVGDSNMIFLVYNSGFNQKLLDSAKVDLL